MLLQFSTAGITHSVLLATFIVRCLHMQGRGWVDGEPASRMHSSMVAAAIAWNKFIGCKHPDLEFFARQRLQNMANANGRSLAR